MLLAERVHRAEAHLGVLLTTTASGTTVQGNIIGLNATGTAAVANDGIGMRVYSSNYIIGGTTAETRNVISGNFASGLWIDGSNNNVRGNYMWRWQRRNNQPGQLAGMRLPSAVSNNLIAERV